MAAALWATAGALTYSLALRQDWLESARWPTWFALPILAAGFALTEVFVVHLRLRANAHTFSLVELPLALGLFFAQPLVLAAAQIIGAGLALVFHRRQSALKLAFNTGVFAATTLIAVGTFRWFGGASGALTQRTLLVGAAALLAEAALSVVLVFIVISMSTGSWRAPDLRSGLAFGLTAAAFTASLGVIAVVVVDAQPGIAWLLAIPTSGTYLANWAYSNQRRRHEGLDFLYQSARLLHGSPEIETALVQLLRHACDTFNADAAEVVYLSESDDMPMSVRVGPGSLIETNAARDARHSTLMALTNGSSAKIIDRRSTGDGRSYLEESGYRNVIVAPMRGERRVVGALVVANRLGDVLGFDATDALLAETLANHTATALENGRLEQSLEQLRVLEGRLTFQATHDPLTGLANRTLFRSELDGVLSRPDRPHGAVIFIDLDDFKAVNDSFGHAAGDALLIDVARRLRSNIDDTDTIARLGGDEFAVLLRDVSDADAAGTVAARVLESFAPPSLIERRRHTIRASIGIALVEPGCDPEAMMRNADTAMYTAKAQGKHRTVVFRPEMYESNLRRFNLQAELQRAIVRAELEPYFQPIVSIVDGRLLGAEVLVRWNHPTLGRLVPDLFLGLAEESDLIADVDRVMLEAACAWLAATEHTDPGLVPRINVNLSPRSLAEPGLPESIARELRRHGLGADRLGVEITEKLMSEHAETAIGALTELHAMGLELSLDDFGTGYSSLSHLRSLPVDVVKIAKPFIDDIDTSSSQRAFSAAIIALASALDLRVIAEGVERPEQLRVLAGLRCDAGQGYLYSPPLDGDAFLDWARAHHHARLVSA